MLPDRTNPLSRVFILHLLALLSGVRIFLPGTHGRLVKVLSNETSINFSENQWAGPITFDWLTGVDTPGVGGPNSTVCAMGVPSRYATADGASFQFSFRGISAQLVFSSRPDHSAFSVDYDGRTFSGDTYSRVVSCGAAWTSSVGTAVEDHTITCTNHPVGRRGYLEILSILYDDGSDLPPSAEPAPPSAPLSQTSTSTPTSAKDGAPNQPTQPVETAGGHTFSPSVDLGATSTSTGGPLSETATAPHPTRSIGSPPPVSAGAIAGLAVGVALGLGLLLCAFVWLRRRYGAARKGLQPLTLPPARVVEAKGPMPMDLAEPAKPSKALLLQSNDSAHGFSYRLADEDINRIAARMHALFKDQRIRHRRTDSSGNLRQAPDSPETELPPY